MTTQTKSRAQFASNFGFLAAAAGSAIGLGNIWKFPYLTGIYGGAAFLFVYLGIVFGIGIPVMLSELIIGRRSRSNAIGAFKKLAPHTPWMFTGMFGVAAAFLIMSFYGVVSGWSIKYIVFSVQNHFHDSSPEMISQAFQNFISSPLEPLIYQVIFMIMTGGIVIIGVQKGIEGFSKFLMPLLFIIIIILDIRALTLEGAREGLRFLFKPDFSKLTYEGVLAALGQAFFSLSLGMGTLITYGSYVNKKNNLLKTSIQVSLADTLAAVLAGVAIFPAVFAFNIAPGEGVGLAFITLPNVFLQMPGGYIFSILFFILLTIAALTSSISILEVVVAYFTEELKIKRSISVIMASVLATILGIVCSLSMGLFSDYKLFGLSFFDLMDFISSNLLLPLGGMLIALFVGWSFGKKRVMFEIAHGGKLRGWFLQVFMILVKFVAPVAIFLVFLRGSKILDFLISRFTGN
jgi:neurotransmitter:Na+ symporter, NSS family